MLCLVMYFFNFSFPQSASFFLYVRFVRIVCQAGADAVSPQKLEIDCTF